MTTKNQLIGILFATIALAGCSKDNITMNAEQYVEVIGTAEKEIDPDIFYLNFTLSETDSLKSNIKILEQKMLDVFNSLKVDTENDLSVTNMSGNNWNWWRRGQKVYQNKSYQLKTTNLELINNVCDKLDSMGYASYYMSKVDYSKIDELKQETQREAVQKARLKAENLLSADSRKVYELIYLQEREVYTPMPMYELRLNKEANTNGASQSQIDFKKIKVSSEVVARFSIR